MSNREKGKRTEREAASLYEDAGYRTFRPQESKFGETDMFGLFDVLAILPRRFEDIVANPVRLVQVKSNTASGIHEWVEETQEFLQPGVTAEYLVKTDREGWRLMKPVNVTDTGWTYRTEVDERKQDVNIGEGVRAYLEEL